MSAIILSKYISAPNEGLALNRYSIDATEVSNQVDLRVDHNFSPTHTAFVRFSGKNWRKISPTTYQAAGPLTNELTSVGPLRYRMRPAHVVPAGEQGGLHHVADGLHDGHPGVPLVVARDHLESVRKLCGYFRDCLVELWGKMRIDKGCGSVEQQKHSPSMLLLKLWIIRMAPSVMYCNWRYIPA